MPLDLDKKRYLEARKAYYAGKPIMTDAVFDALEDSIRSNDPKWAPLHSTGVKVGKKKSIKLLRPQPSLNKIATHEADRIDRWLSKMRAAKYQSMVVMPKIDGASYQLVYRNGNPTGLYTRGDGITGEDVSHFLPHLKLPRKLRNFNAIIRCEIAMRRSVFDKKWRDVFKSDRNLASGLFNRQDVHAAMADMDVICLRLLDRKPSKDFDGTLSEGLETLQKRGFEVVPFKTFTLSPTPLAKMTEKLKAGDPLCVYRTDGYVVHIDDHTNVTADRPEHAFAFKYNNAEGTETTITGITWEASKHGSLIPTAQIKPIEVDGATLRNVTLNNASWMKLNHIGVGAVVRVFRSGDIIPKIVKVIKPAKFILPDRKKHGDYEWDVNETHLVLKNRSTNSEAVRNLLNSFFNALDVDHIGPKQVDLLVKAGATNTIEMTKLTVKKCIDAGIGAAMANKIVAQLVVLRDEGVPLPLLIKASGVFSKGFGERLAKRLLDQEVPLESALLKKRVQWSKEDCIRILGPVRGEQFMNEWPAFMKWYSRSAIPFAVVKKAKAPVTLSKKLRGQAFTWTGYRDEDQERIVLVNDGRIVPFGGQTTVLLYSPSGKASSKVEKAEMKGVLCLRWEQAVRRFNLM